MGSPLPKVFQFIVHASLPFVKPLFRTNSPSEHNMKARTPKGVSNMQSNGTTSRRVCPRGASYYEWQSGDTLASVALAN